MIRVKSVLGVAFLVVQSTEPLRRFGVPQGGPFDMDSASAAAAYLGEPKGPVAWIELSGRIELEGPGSLGTCGLDGVADGLAEAGPFSAGVRAYRGYLALPLSQAPWRVTQLLRPGFELGDTWAPDAHSAAERLPTYEDVKYLPGPFSELLAGEDGTVSPQSDRRGVRLMGVGRPHPLELPSRPTVPGAIQVTPDGTAIVLGPDGPTIGGYPVAGYVDREGMNRIAQARPGEQVRLRRTG